MKKTPDQKSKETTVKGATITTIHCVNTKRKYIYEIIDGDIVNEKITQAE